MQITSKSGKVYEMQFVRYGCSYAEPLMLIKKTYFKFFTITHKISLIYWADNMIYSIAIAAKPEILRKWFTDTVNKYEDYQAWKQENNRHDQ